MMRDDYRELALYWRRERWKFPSISEDIDRYLSKEKARLYLRIFQNDPHEQSMKTGSERRRAIAQIKYQQMDVDCQGVTPRKRVQKKLNLWVRGIDVPVVTWKFDLYATEQSDLEAQGDSPE